ncbi:ABC-type Na+ efflux pump permease component-like protein [Metallosphaera sedula]|uniref:ABC-type Na+ efflux pump permease component-like protein n=3 Tax=Metallosphaera TaxID=41980 RepID=A4YEE1_METS5|nr:MULTISPECIES: ABC transporter permease [Metallosphaera]ABP94793.1 ABC-type Na+ efflux pump permease component-like protein [Metallosphaera sedula DSM 5348]AIM26780.1 ABC-type Na+ efflux pump permease component-like protein [Metallosphaera sedula]AKV73733.1 sodium ABC transporter permease [Metallosphaera sedula]AKV75973.1 sodium ABC transporter permease [Metallosphaera sedula]AKV78224.1 sodium ABC transporter permease [Metallosphaera sedula]
MLYDLLKKEWIDLKRDRKILLVSILLPLFLLPLIGVIIYASVASQPPTVGIINNDTSNTPYVNELASYVRSHGGIVYINNFTIVPDVEIIFPQGFAENISNIDKVAMVREIVLISSQSNAQNIVNNGLYQILYNTSLERISFLANESHVNVSPSTIREPLVVELGYIKPTKQVASSSTDRLGQLARVISLILFPAATPVIFFLTDGILGEKERKTLESLLASPISPFQFISAKLIISMALGAISSLGDLVGLIAFSVFAPFIVGGNAGLTLTFSLSVVIAYLLMVLLTASISLVLLILIGGSQRNIQLINLVITGFGMLASFSSLVLNFSSLGPLSFILVIPYVQIVGGLLDGVFGLTTSMIYLYLGTLTASILLIVISSRILNPERLLLK